MDWNNPLISKLVIPALVTLGAWVWGKVTSRKREDKQAQKQETRSLFDDIVENFIYEQLDKYPLGVDVETYLKGSRVYIENQIWDVAQKRGIPKNAVTEALFHAAMERGTALLAREVNQLRQIQEQRKHELELAKLTNSAP